MNKTALIIGYGSIGERHAKLLKKFKNISKIYILTKRICNNFNKIKSISEIKKINPDYIVISSRTSDHFKHLSYVEKNLKNKIILVEKPLFKNFKNLKIRNNKVFVGYNLRYHPVIHFVRNYVKNKKIFSINVYCHSYLPHWRKNINYVKSNSAKKTSGGGALLELSHEIDYLQWIFKKIKKLNHAIIKKISNLKIDTEDYVSIIGKTSLADFIIDLNFFSLNPQRLIIVNGNDFSLKGDLIGNSVEIFKKNTKKVKKFKIDKNYTYNLQHKSLLSKKYGDSCTYIQGKQLMLLIDKIRKFKN
jgi:CMP-N,N'-diacetyllegionaminic acid synthase